MNKISTALISLLAISAALVNAQDIINTKKVPRRTQSVLNAAPSEVRTESFVSFYKKHQWYPQFSVVNYHIFLGLSTYPFLFSRQCHCIHSLKQWATREKAKAARIIKNSRPPSRVEMTILKIWMDGSR
mmetsp:Transcript_12185/g.15458  ORF Transcript_12185/g.15458 Transcript_12185/m.15458 type:complete len:129 (-) Transcript_12185:682-1068(-)